MIEIDGSLGHGQVLRSAIALAGLTLRPVRITHIRQQRPRPGLMPQHLMGIKVAGEFCQATVLGLNVGSMEVEFVPSQHVFENKKIDIGTAGSIPLLLQTLLPMLAFVDREISLEIVGGTAGLGAPTIEYIQHITLPVLHLMGLPRPKMEIMRQGFYPKGQGFVKLHFSPADGLKAVRLVERGKVKGINGISIAGSLPKHIAHRQAYSATGILMGHGYREASVSMMNNIYTASSGTSITLWAECENTILGSDGIGKIGVRAEEIGENCANELIKSLNSQAALDKWMADQIIPFIVLASGRSEVRVEEITEHCRTNMRVCERLLNVKFEVDEENKRISLEGIGFKR